LALARRTLAMPSSGGAYGARSGGMSRASLLAVAGGIV
jgi:hypothetical protein